MIIGIDIDDTITNTSQTIQKYLKQEYPDYENYRLLPRKEYRKFLKKHLVQMRREYTLKDGVKEAWEYFIAHQFTIIIITARGKKYDKDNEAYTKSFLQDHGLVYDKIYFHQKKKVKKALREHVEIFIDDKEWILDEMNKYGIKSLCMGKSSKYPSFDNWYQVLDYIKEEYHGR